MRGAAGAIVRARARPASAQLIAAAAGAVRPIATEPDHALQCSATLETGILQGSAQVIRQQARAAAVHRWCGQHRRLACLPATGRGAGSAECEKRGSGVTYLATSDVRSGQLQCRPE